MTIPPTLGWLIAALVCFVIDTVILVIIGFDPGRVFGSVVNIVFHIWVIVSLILGIVAHFKLKKAAEKAAADKAAAPETVDGSFPAWSGWRSFGSFTPVFVMGRG